MYSYKALVLWLLVNAIIVGWASAFSDGHMRTLSSWVFLADFKCSPFILWPGQKRAVVSQLVPCACMSFNACLHETQTLCCTTRICAARHKFCIVRHKLCVVRHKFCIVWHKFCVVQHNLWIEAFLFDPYDRICVARRKICVTCKFPLKDRLRVLFRKPFLLLIMGAIIRWQVGLILDSLVHACACFVNAWV
jgi:hypothetical protein